MSTLVKLDKKMNEIYHYPVMYREVLEALSLNDKKLVVDCTVGIGSHAIKLLQAMPKGSRLIGVDRDKDSLDIARKRLESFKGRFTLVQGDFLSLDKILNNLGIEGVDACLFDLGISTYQLSNPERGFSFLKEGPLDMRMDRNSFLSAQDLVNNLSETELANIFHKFGEERFYKKIAYSIIEARKKEPILTTGQLTRIIVEVLPSRAHYYKIHPATRIFQALRIAVNRELESLKVGLNRAISFLNSGGRIGVISFHSLEDRIAKHTFKNYSREGILKLINKKPYIPSAEEIEENSASRSAKLRVAQKI